MSPPHVRTLPVAYANLPGWAADDHLAAFTAFCASDGGEDPSAALKAVCARALAEVPHITTAEHARAFFEAHFTPHRVDHDGPGGLLTGYYEPVIDGSLTYAPPFVVPVYRRPADLENCVAESERGAKSAGFTHMRRTAQGLEPYATRQAIEQGALAGQGLELCFLADPVDAFFLHVQGSGVIRLGDGVPLRITYDGKNGHPYTSIGRTLIADGTFAPDSLTLQALGDWLRADLVGARTVMWRNESFVFFRELAGDTPVGVLGTPLHPGRSLAVDTAFQTLGRPIYVSAPTMTHVGPQGFHRLMIAHDVGSAIKGPERGDIYFGTGPQALALAGVTKHAGVFFVLIPKDAP